MPNTVRDVMTPNALILNPHDKVVRAAALMRDQDMGALPVGENDRLIGMLTDRDIVKRTTGSGSGKGRRRRCHDEGDPLLF